MLEDDWASVRAVRLRALRDAPLAFWATYEEEERAPEAWWREFMRAGEWFLARSDNAIVGVAACLDPRDGREAEVISVWVDPAVRSMGIGLALVQAAVASRSRTERAVALEVAEDNAAARALYEKCGFDVAGPGEGLPHSPEQRQLRMTLTFPKV